MLPLSWAPESQMLDTAHFADNTLVFFIFAAENVMLLFSENKMKRGHITRFHCLLVPRT